MNLVLKYGSVALGAWAIGCFGAVLGLPALPVVLLGGAWGLAVHLGWETPQ